MILADFSDLVSQSLPGIIAAFVAAWLSSKWAVKKFREEKWWVKREAAYSELIEALHLKIRCYDKLSTENYPGTENGEPTEEQKKERSERFQLADGKILKAEDVGAFWISREATEVLERLRKREKLEWNESPTWEVCEQEYLDHQRALVSIKQIAMADLKLPNPWRFNKTERGFGFSRR